MFLRIMYWKSSEETNFFFCSGFSFVYRSNGSVSCRSACGVQVFDCWVVCDVNLA